MSDEAYLEQLPQNRKQINTQEVTWASISEDGQSATIRWDIVETYAVEFDICRQEGKQIPETLVFCKLLLLVRQQERWAARA